MGIIAINHCQ